MDMKEQIVQAGEFCFRAGGEELGCADEYLEVSGDGNVPPAIYSAAFSNEMGDAVGKQLHVVPAVQLHVLVGRHCGV